MSGSSLQRLAGLGVVKAVVASAAILGCSEQAAPTPAASGASAQSASAPSAATSGATSVSSSDAAVPEPTGPTTDFDGAPAAAAGLEAKPLEWPKQHLAMRAPKGWTKAVVQGYPVVRSEGGKAFVALFGDVGALPPRTHLDMRVKWLDGFAVDWGRSGNGKVGPEHLGAELREGPGKVVDTVDGKRVGRDARFWAVYLEPRGRSEGLLVLAAARADAPERVAEIVAMVQSITAL